MTLKVGILPSLRRLFIILVGLTMTSFSEKMLISNICIRGLMPNLIKKSWTVSRDAICTTLKITGAEKEVISAETIIGRFSD